MPLKINEKNKQNHKWWHNFVPNKWGVTYDRHRYVFKGKHIGFITLYECGQCNWVKQIVETFE